jgi:hypothetical protein
LAFNHTPPIAQSLEIKNHPKGKKTKKIIRSCSPTKFVKAAAGYPLVVLAGRGQNQ